MPRKQLHQSGLEMIAKCGVQFSYRYLEGIKRKPNAFLVCGSATDKAVGHDLEVKIATGELEQEAALLDVARDAVEAYPDKEDIELEGDDKGKAVTQVLGETKDKAVRLVKAHHGVIAPTIRPFQTARKFSIDLDKFLRERAKELHQRAEQADKPVARVLHEQARCLNVAAREGLDFVGEMDIVERWDGDGTMHQAIRDTKTSGKSPNEKTADESHQLSAYALASLVIDGALPDAVKLDYLIDLKGGTKTMTLASTRDGKDMQNYLNRIVAAVVSIESGNFVPAANTAWWCAEKWCAYHSICPFVRNATRVIPVADLSGSAGKNLVQIEAAE